MQILDGKVVLEETYIEQILKGRGNSNFGEKKNDLPSLINGQILLEKDKRLL